MPTTEKAWTFLPGGVGDGHGHLVGSHDRIGYPCIHGAGTTHLDSFAHVFFNGKMWNGYPVEGLVTKEAAPPRTPILTMKNGIVTRGALQDIPRLKGVPYLEPGNRIFAEDLEAWEQKAGVKAMAWRRTAPALGPVDAPVGMLGPWPINDAMAGLDNSGDPVAQETRHRHTRMGDSRLRASSAWRYPEARCTISRWPSSGIHILDRVDLDAADQAAASRNRWEFMLTIAPLPIPSGTGSPVNPIAMSRLW